ncbi:MAG: hypothetical protein M1826_006049 [Phylliscum demangeonii]|nr:MAG: hypothetical protein M1826_006049 [Phylliscum demangeonii]
MPSPITGSASAMILTLQPHFRWPRPTFTGLPALQEDAREYVEHIELLAGANPTRAESLCAPIWKTAPVWNTTWTGGGTACYRAPCAKPGAPFACMSSWRTLLIANQIEALGSASDGTVASDGTATSPEQGTGQTRPGCTRRSRNGTVSSPAHGDRRLLELLKAAVSEPYEAVDPTPELGEGGGW